MVHLMAALTISGEWKSQPSRFGEPYCADRALPNNAKASLFGCGHRAVGRQPLDRENYDAHGHEEGTRRCLGHRDEGENDN
jgi:hypothetical protein